MDSSIDQMETIFNIPSQQNNRNNMNCQQAELPSLIFDEVNRTIKKREPSLYLRPICIDALDVSTRYTRMLLKNRNTYLNDRPTLNVRSISLVLWYFISRGHTAVAFLDNNLQYYAAKCSDPHELYMLAKLELVMFEGNDSPGSLPYTIANCTRCSDGCIVGSRRKYTACSRRDPKLIDVVINRLLRASFQMDNCVKINGDVDLSLNLSEGTSNTRETVSFQLTASDQLYLMSRLAKILENESYSELCAKARELDVKGGCGLMKNKLPNQGTMERNDTPYHYNDPFLPEYVAPPPPRQYETHKVTRIGNKNSIYKVGQCSSDSRRTECSASDGSCHDPEYSVEGAEDQMTQSIRRPLVEALERIFGAEKAQQLCQAYPNCNDINDFFEMGLI